MIEWLFRKTPTEPLDVMPYHSPDERIRELERELYQARRAVVSMLPPAIETIADDFYGIESRRDAFDWEARLVGAVIDLAWPLAEETRYCGTRAYCPLCRRGSSGPYVEGFTVPEGLRRHLLGEGTANPCVVLTQVLEGAKDYWLPRVLEAEGKQRVEDERERDQRRSVEEQFVVDPRSPPKLIDENLWYGSGPRDRAGLEWAKKRLRELGFEENQDGRVSKFTRDSGAVVVFADPRAEGRIDFRVYRREQVERPTSRKRWVPDHQSFHLRDTWKNKLEEKVDQRIDEAAKSLTSKKKR